MTPNHLLQRTDFCELLNKATLGRLGFSGGCAGNTNGEGVGSGVPASESDVFSGAPQAMTVAVDPDSTEEFESMVIAWPNALGKPMALGKGRGPWCLPPDQQLPKT